MVIVCDNCGYFYDSDFDSVCPGCKSAPNIPQGNPVSAFDSFDSFAAPAAEPVKEPEQENYKMPMNEQFVPLTQEQYNPPVQEQFNTPVQEEYRMPMNEQFVPLTQEQYNPPIQPKYDAPVQAQFIPPVIPEADSNQATAPVVKTENKKRCVSCGQEIPEANAFCRYCGAPQVKKEEAPPAPVYRCSSCSAEVSRPDSLCPDCEMRATAPLQKPVAPLFMEDNLVFPSPAEPAVPEPIIPEPIAEPIAPEPVPEPVIPEPFIPQDIVPEPAHEPVSEPIPEPVPEVVAEPEPDPEYDFMSAPTIVVDPIVNKVVDEPFPDAGNQADEMEYPKTEAAPNLQRAAARCPLCAKEIDNPDYLFCPYCGSSLAKKASPESVQIPVQPAAEPVISQPPVQQEAAPVYYPNLVPGQFMCENCGTVMNYGEKMCSNCFAPVSSMKGISAVTNVNAAPADNSDIIPERNPLTAIDYDKMVVPDFFAGDDTQL